MPATPAVSIVLHDEMPEITVGVDLPAGEPPLGWVRLGAASEPWLCLVGEDPEHFDALAQAAKETARRLRAGKVALVEEMPA